ncbi:spore coat U domain-containing protein [Acidithiobacillus sp. M4-SHS-6]|uniref:Csu type fimbrial protein n=1 Tax=Acidithiobacillus sp. M4-SHS-6 TaxID=3383024 RepID=UPI0039BE0DE8
MKFNMLSTAALSFSLLLASAGIAQAASTATTTFNVTATVPAFCKVSATNLNFGNYTPGSGAVTGNSTISVNCTKGTTFTVALNAGSSTGASFTNRNMTGTGAADPAGNTATTSDLLNYQLYTTATVGSGGTIWGDGSTGTSTVAGTGAGMGTPQAVAETVYGQIPDSTVNSTAVPGAYSDTVTVTVSY